MLFGESKYIVEFCEAALDSFTEYGAHYNQYLLARDETQFRKAGHKIKPVAQMLGLDNLLEEYENAKILLQTESSDQFLEESVQRVDEIIKLVIQDCNYKCCRYRAWYKKRGSKKNL